MNELTCVLFTFVTCNSSGVLNCFPLSCCTRWPKRPELLLKCSITNFIVNFNLSKCSKNFIF